MPRRKKEEKKETLADVKMNVNNTSFKMTEKVALQIFHEEGN